MRQLNLQETQWKESGDTSLEIYSNFTYLPERDESAGGEDKLLAEKLDNYATVMVRFADYF